MRIYGNLLEFMGPVGVSKIVKQIDGTVGCVRIGEGL